MQAALCSIILLTGATLFSGCNTLCILGHGHHDEEAICRNPDLELSLSGHPVGVYIFGTSGPPVLLLHELPGLTHECIRLAEQIQARGYRVYVPLLFGSYGESRAGISQIIKACRSGGFHCFSDRDSTRPLTDFIRKELFPVMKKDGSRTVVIGMCLTGPTGVALLGTEDLFVAAAVMSQPAVPFDLTGRHAWATGLSADETSVARASGKQILAFRFSRDCLSRPERMAAFEAAFPGQITVRQLDSGPGNCGEFSAKAHAVLTKEYDKGKPSGHAVQLLLDFLDSNLKSKSP